MCCQFNATCAGYTELLKLFMTGSTQWVVLLYQTLPTNSSATLKLESTLWVKIIADNLYWNTCRNISISQQCMACHDHRLLGHGVILLDMMARGETICTHVSQPSKIWNSITGEYSLTGIQETCWFSMTIPTFTQVYKPRRQLLNLVGLWSPIPPIVLIWCCQIFIVLGHWRMHCMRQGLKTMRTWFVHWGNGHVYRKWAGTGKICMPLFCAGARP
jgi:hypothetical protein